MHNLDRDLFISQYWQRLPLLIENAIPNFRSPISPEELAGLALESEVESRIIQVNEGQWEQEHGPFNDNSFQRDNLWTLLVQAVDHYVPAVAELKALVDFLPGWRIDDVMVSYAPEGGSVGPHYDNYDVFLLQGKGHREWRLGQYCSSDEELMPHDELRILKQFRERERHLLKPGDILYVPPRLAHWGIAQDDCMTYSIGFRAPRLNDMLGRWLDQVLETMDPELFYRDPLNREGLRAGEINGQAMHEAYHLLQQLLVGHMASPQWFGELVTETRYPVEPADQEEPLDNFRSVQLDNASRLAWWQGNGIELVAFANGQAIECGRECLPLLEKLCQHWPIEGADLEAARENQACRDLLEQLLALGCIYGGD